MNEKDRDNLLVSIGLITYNRPEYLSGVIDSWLAQTYRNFELIISNDASPDERTDYICREYARKDKRIRYFKQKGNLGILRNQKFVLYQARGKYFVWSADDDLRDTRFLEECLGVHYMNPGLVMVFANMIDIDKDGNILRRPDPAKYLPLSDSAYERLKAYTLFYSQDGKVQLILGLWNRETILNDHLFGLNVTNGKPPDYWGFDNYFVFQNLAKGPLGITSRSDFFRRSRVLEDDRKPRPLLPRLAVTFVHRIRKIFASPYFYYVARCIVNTRELSFGEKIKLLLWNVFVMARLFFCRKM
ncbi:MAG: hypothetical protein RL681_114 [Candidatus Parcubacteria bacterium]|jgi:glycosyltransferase involved in cell wall biosynthesis